METQLYQPTNQATTNAPAGRESAFAAQGSSWGAGGLTRFPMDGLFNERLIQQTVKGAKEGENEEEEEDRRTL